MLSKEEFIDVVNKYDLVSCGFERTDYLEKLIPALERKEILILKGIRRCGKTTILKQLIKYLKEKKVKEENILYVNFDDFNFLPNLSIELLELMLSTKNTKEKQYFFLDEIQKIPMFESWLRTQYDRGLNAKFIISGSNATLLSKDMATLLTGRNLTYEIFPLSFKEYLEFSKGDLDEYLQYGGFPEVVLEKDENQKLNLLRNYLSDIINKDIMLRRNIRDQKQLLTFIQYILQNPCAKFSINTLSKLTDVSKETVSKYLEYMLDAYLIIEVSFFSYSAKAKFNRTQNPKYYLVDNGFYKINTPRIEIGKLYENVVANHFFRRTKEIFYWDDEKSEVDFVAGEEAINVTSTKEILEREIIGLENIRKKHKHIKKCVIINSEKREIINKIDFVNIEYFLKNNS
jgi:uncharacterized protein